MLARVAAARRTSTSTPASGRCGARSSLHDPFAGHDAFVTIGERIGQPGLHDPDVRARLDHDAAAGRARAVAGAGAGDRRDGGFTSVGELARPVRADRVRGRDLRPARARVPPVRATCRAHAPSAFEVALDIHAAETARPRAAARERLAPRRPGARRRPTRGPTATTCSARRAELMIAKNMYVASRSGWFSDRSICYLASGRPVRGAGHRASRSSTRSARACSPSTTRTRPRRRRGGRERLRPPLRELRARSPRSTSTRTACSGGCSAELGVA